MAVSQLRATIGDVARAAACLPGLAIGERLDPRTFKATMGVQVGLLVVRYTGTLSVGETIAPAGAVRFRVQGIAPGGLTLDVAVEIAAAPRTEMTSSLAIVNGITLDPGTTLLAGPMIATVGGMLLDGFSRNLKRVLEVGQVSPASTGVRPQR